MVDRGDHAVGAEDQAVQHGVLGWDFVADQEIYLLYLFDKDEREDLSPDERKLLRELAAECKR